MLFTTPEIVNIKPRMFNSHSNAHIVKTNKHTWDLTITQSKPLMSCPFLFEQQDMPTRKRKTS